MIIVGGGPAGSAAARTLSARGLDVCLVDKHTFPRDKICGGLLTLRSKKIFHEAFQTSWDPVIEVISGGVRFFHKERYLNSVHNYKNLYFTRRYKFDEYLLGLAEKAGVQLHLGTGVRMVNSKTGSVELKDGNVLRSKYIIGADGVNSVVAGSIFDEAFDKTRMALGLEMEIPKNDLYQKINDPEIYFGVARWGYGWVFPKRDTLTVGIGGLYSKNADLMEAFKGFLRARFGDVPRVQIKGHYMPFGDYRAQPGKHNVLLCGDAAGLVEPITGEGIAFAMQSGYYAALSIMEALSQCDGKEALKLYKEKYKRITSALDHGNMLRYLIFPKPSQYIFVNILPKTQSVTRKHMDLMADEMEYGDYVRFLIGKISKGVFKKTIWYRKKAA